MEQPRPAANVRTAAHGLGNRPCRGLRKSEGAGLRITYNGDLEAFAPPPKRSFGTPFSLIDSFEEGEAIAEPPFDSNYPPKNGTADERT